MLSRPCALLSLCAVALVAVGCQNDLSLGRLTGNAGTVPDGGGDAAADGAALVDACGTFCRESEGDATDADASDADASDADASDADASDVASDVDASDASDGKYSPCGGKACGAECSICAPDAADCVETLVVKLCNSAGVCEPKFPTCG